MSQEHDRNERDRGTLPRRDLLKASVATGAAGMLAGCAGNLGSDTAGESTPEHDGCPPVLGVENGFLWVQKTPPGPWGGEISHSSTEQDPYDDPYVSGDGSGPGFRGRANIGQAKLQFDEPGSFEFRYRADPNGLTWVEEPRSLISILFPTEPWEENGLVRNSDIVRWSIYPYEEDHPLTMSFEIDEPGTYRIAYGPASGQFIFEEWLPDISERDRSMRLGLRIEGDERKYSWVYPEIPNHVWVWGGEDDIILNSDPHESEADCELDEPVP